jgi:transposase
MSRGGWKGTCWPAGERVVRVPPRLMAGARQAVRALGKSDPIDALAVARAALREPNLPTAGHDQASWEVKLLVDHREHLIAERTRAINRLRWHLHRLDPDLEHTARRLPGPSLGQITAWLAGTPWSVQVAICQELTAAIAALTVRIDQLDHDLRTRVAELAPNLLSLPGCGVLTAAKLLAETAGVARFRSEACVAMHAGVAPIPASSGRTDRHRLCRGGNRQLDAAIHRIAITQLRLAGPARPTTDGGAPRATAPVTPSAPSSDPSPVRSTNSSSWPSSGYEQTHLLLDRGAT